MPLPRPLLLALLGAALVGAVFMGTRGSGDSADEETSADVAPAPEPDTSAPPLTQNPGPVTKDPRKAMAGASSVTSGTFELKLDVRSRRHADDRISLSADGRFQSRGLAKTPLFEANLTAESGGGSIDVGAVSTGDRAYLVREGKALVLQAKGWDALTRARVLQSKGGPLDKPNFGYSDKEVDSLKFVAEETNAGTPVLHFRGRVDAKETRSEIAGLAELFTRTSLGSRVPWTLARTLQAGTIDVWVGKADHVVRRERQTLRAGGGTVVSYDYQRANLGEPQKITAPARSSNATPAAAGWARDSFGLAFSALAVAALGIEPSDGDAAQGKQQGDREPAPKAKPEPKAGPAPKAQRGRERPARERRGAGRRTNAVTDVRRAVDQRKVVVLFFRQAGADDDAVASAVNAQRGRRGVAVFALRVGQAPKFEQFGGALVVRAPSILIVGRDRAPRLYEGFIDSATLAQAVTDAR